MARISRHGCCDGECVLRLWGKCGDAGDPAGTIALETSDRIDIRTVGDQAMSASKQLLNILHSTP